MFTGAGDHLEALRAKERDRRGIVFGNRENEQRRLAVSLAGGDHAEEEGAAAAKERADRREWLIERGYRVVSVAAGDVERDAAAVIDQLDTRIAALEAGS
jgi:very-short-patch-repair endonuclease